MASSSDGKSIRPRRRLFVKQPIMLRMVYCLGALAVTAVYYFGWRVVSVLALVLGLGLTIEFLMTRRRGKGISTACLVTCLLYGLSLPPTVPYFVAGVGAVVAILFGKEVFGGFGHNFVNPAILGRAFVYVCFPVDLTGRFVPAFGGFPGGFAHWSFQSLDRLPDALAAGGRTVADAVSQASPMWVIREYGLDVAARGVSWVDLALGSIAGTFQPPGASARIISAGSAGEGCAVVIALAAVYLLVTRTANWRLMLSGLLGLVLANTLWRHGLGFAGTGEVPPVWVNLLGGTTMYVLVFMITDPVSAPKRAGAQVAYGLLIGFLIVTLRWRGVFVAAATFSVLLGNLVGPLLDLADDAWRDRRKRAGSGPEEAAA